MSLRIAITITSHNRQPDLARTLIQLSHLDPAPDEILVCADGCTDGTAAWLKADHPAIRVIEHAVAQGSIPSRNELIRATGCEVIISLDDDSYPLDPDFIDRVRGLFIRHPRLAVASFAQRSDEFPDSLSCSDFGPTHFAGSYANSSAAIRRSVFLELGGYPDFFFHAYEEPDFALRCVSAGWQVRFLPSPQVRHHFTTAQRNEMRMHHRHARNEFWSVLMRCPRWPLIPVAIFRALRQFVYAMRRGPSWILNEPVWWRQALRGIPECLQQRTPIAWPRYLAWMRLVRRPIQSELEWNEQFSPSPR